MQYYKGECDDYGYHYPHHVSPSMTSLHKHKTPVTVKKTDHRPLSSLGNKKNKKLCFYC